MKSIPHDLGLLVDAQLFESFLHPTNRHGDESEDREREVFELEGEHCRRTKLETKCTCKTKQSKRKCYEDESEGIRDEVDVVFVAKVSVERYGVLHGVETCNRGTLC